MVWGQWQMLFCSGSRNLPQSRTAAHSSLPYFPRPNPLPRKSTQSLKAYTQLLQPRIPSHTPHGTHARMPAATATLNPPGGPTPFSPAPAQGTNDRHPQLPKGALIGGQDLPLSACVPPPPPSGWGWRGRSISASSFEQPRWRRRVVAVAPSVRSGAGGEGAAAREEEGSS